MAVYLLSEEIIRASVIDNWLDTSEWYGNLLQILEKPDLHEPYDNSNTIPHQPDYPSHPRASPRGLL
jgi:hypothetical protein